MRLFRRKQLDPEKILIQKEGIANKTLAELENSANVGAVIYSPEQSSLFIQIDPCKNQVIDPATHGERIGEKFFKLAWEIHEYETAKNKDFKRKIGIEKLPKQLYKSKEWKMNSSELTPTKLMIYKERIGEEYHNIYSSKLIDGITNKIQNIESEMHELKKRFEKDHLPRNWESGEYDWSKIPKSEVPRWINPIYKRIKQLNPNYPAPYAEFGQRFNKNPDQVYHFLLDWSATKSKIYKLRKWGEEEVTLVPIIDEQAIREHGGYEPPTVLLEKQGHLLFAKNQLVGIKN